MERFGNELCVDDINFAMEVASNPTGRSAEADEYPFKVLMSTDEIVQHMVESIADVNSVVEIPATKTRILLNHFKWDKEELVERFYDGNQDQLFVEARVVNPFRKLPVIKKKKRPIRKTAKNSAEECAICFMVIASSMMTDLDCGHRYCTQCWVEYLTTKIMEEGVSSTIACAANGCDILVDDDTIMSLVSDSKVKSKYQRLVINSFVECNKLLRWCPYPNCSNAIKVQYVEARPVTCKCSHTFCFSCGENWHDPIKCRLLKKWIKKFEDDSETMNWISANTKDCPKCNAAIEKNGGCNHMICRNRNCRTEFCWMCLELWKLHGQSGYNCNKYDEEKAKATKNVLTSRAALERYLFYCNRYMNHMQSLKFEHKLYDNVKSKMELMQMENHNMSWIEVQFLKKVVDILCQCRQTLMYTYAFAFYLKKNNQSAIFEDNQRDLETAVETLSGFLERDITSENFVDIKQKVQDKYRYCDCRRRVLLEHVYEGYENGWWEYDE